MAYTEKDMITKENKETIESVSREFLQKLDLGPNVTIQEREDNVIAIDVTVEEPRMFIGEKGQTLAEVQHLLKAMLRKRIDEQFYISLDINNYKKNKENYIRELARTTADEVSLLKKEKELPPMPPAERRIVHLELDKREDVVTESAGERDERRVVVRVR